MRKTILVVIFSVVVLAVGFFWLQQRESNYRQKRLSMLKEIAFALNMYETVNRHPVPVAIKDSSGKPLLSWRVTLLPYMEGAPLYDKLHKDEPWDSPHNLQLASEFNRYSEFESSEYRKTSFVALTDSEGNVRAVADANYSHSVMWTAPNDLTIPEAIKKLPTAYTGIPGISKGGAPVARADGTIQWFTGEKLDDLEQFTKTVEARE